MQPVDDSATADAAETDDAPSSDGRSAQPLLTEQVAGHIRDLIVQEALSPGEHIRERALAGELGVSRTPMREALKILATEGLVELLPNRGAIVSDPNPTEVRDMLRVLGVLESLAGELVCVEATEDQLAEIKALHYEMLAAFARKDRLEYFKLNQRIHLAMVAASRNLTLIETHARLNARLYRIRYRSNLKNEEWPSAVEQHEKILEALLARNSRELSTLMRRHLGDTWSKVNEMMEEDSVKPANEAAD